MTFGQRPIEKMGVVDVDGKSPAYLGKERMGVVVGPVSLGMQHGGVADQGKEGHREDGNHRSPPRLPRCVSRLQNA